FVGWVIGEPWIARERDIWMGREALGQHHRVPLCALETDSECSGSADGEKRLDGTRSCAGEFPLLPHRSEHAGISYSDGAPEQIRMSADELRDRLHGDVRTEGERTLVNGRREGIVDGEDSTGLPRRSADNVQVNDTQQRVGRRLEPDQVCDATHTDVAIGVGYIKAMQVPAALLLSGFGESHDAHIAVIR